jgi:hypothetical protein
MRSLDDTEKNDWCRYFRALLTSVRASQWISGTTNAFETREAPGNDGLHERLRFPMMGPGAWLDASHLRSAADGSPVSTQRVFAAIGQYRAEGQIRRPSLCTNTANFVCK